MFNSILLSGKGGVIPIQPTELIIRKARDLRWTHNIKLRGAMDNLHVASALFVECDEFITDDGRIYNEKDKIAAHGMTLLNDGSKTKFLPDSYSQLNLEPINK